MMRASCPRDLRITKGMVITKTGYRIGDNYNVPVYFYYQ